MATRTDRPFPIGHHIKQAREAKGLSHRQIAEATKLSTNVIRALEDGRVASLPAGIYRRSLVRAVSREIGLEPEATLRAFLDQHPAEAPPAAALPEPQPQMASAGLAWRRVLAAIGAVVPLLVGIAYFGGMTPAHRASESPPAAVPTRDADTWRPEIVPAGGFSELPPPASRPVAMAITVSSRCELQVVADGRLVAGRLFDAGESLKVPFGDAVELSGNNAGAVQFSINGRAGRMLGEPGQPLSARIGRDDYSFFLVPR